MLHAVGVVSASGEPLYLRSCIADVEPRRMHSLVYCALDAVDERVAVPKKARVTCLRQRPALTPGKGVPAEPYLGLLTADEFLVFGYAACTRVKFLLVLDEELREADVRDAFRRLHAAYVDAASNPFQPPGAPLVSRAFERAVDAVQATLDAKKR